MEDRMHEFQMDTSDMVTKFVYYGEEKIVDIHLD